MKVNAKIGEKDGDFIFSEVFIVSSQENAKEEVQNVINNFNNTLRPNEKERYLIDVSPMDDSINSIEEFYEEAQRFTSKIYREANNAFGSSWCKKNLDKVVKLKENIGKKGSVTRFKKIVFESPYQQEFSSLIDAKIETL